MRSVHGGIQEGPLVRFSTELKRALIHRYGRLPSAPFVAREFNLRHHGGRAISSESVRRWLQGNCLPQIDRLQTLADWLGIRMGEIFLDAPETTAPKNPASGLDLNSEQRECLTRLLGAIFPNLNIGDLLHASQRDSGRRPHYP